MRKLKWLRWPAFFLAAVFLAMNVIAFLHAYSFTHFSPHALQRTKDPTMLSLSQKIDVLFTGVDNPRPKTRQHPSRDFESVKIGSPPLACWRMVAEDSKGTVILFHGYSSEKSALLGRAVEFLELGYHTLLVDFTGSGASEGNTTTIGFAEAAQVKACVDYVAQRGEGNIYLFGASMGAVAILKAIDEYRITPRAIILECPFGSLYQTVTARFKIMGVPPVPISALLTFWGGVQHGYWAFGHNPTSYAASVECPTLLLYGAKDNRVSRTETEAIYANIKGYKALKVYENVGHNIFQPFNHDRWKADVTGFLSSLP